jgi:hypothetical protein
MLDEQSEFAVKIVETCWRKRVAFTNNNKYQPIHVTIMTLQAQALQRLEEWDVAITLRQDVIRTRDGNIEPNIRLFILISHKRIQ